MPAALSCSFPAFRAPTAGCRTLPLPPPAAGGTSERRAVLDLRAAPQLLHLGPGSQLVLRGLSIRGEGAWPGAGCGPLGTAASACQAGSAAWDAAALQEVLVCAPRRHTLRATHSSPPTKPAQNGACPPAVASAAQLLASAPDAEVRGSPLFPAVVGGDRHQVGLARPKGAVPGAFTSEQGGARVGS